jgi:transposase
MITNGYMTGRVAVAVPHSPWPVDDIVAVRTKLEELAREERYDDAIALMLDLLVRVRDDNTALKVRLHNALRQLYGRRSEKVGADQLSLLFEQLGEDAPDGASQIVEEAKQGTADDSAASETTDSEGAAPNTEETVQQPDQSPRSLRRREGRSSLPSHLPREQEHSRVTGSDRICDDCGEEKQTIGWEISEYLEFVPAHLKVIQQHREKVACSNCDEPGIVTAPNEKVMPYGLPGPRLLGQVVISKFDFSQPLYRQSDIFEQSGVRIPDSTLGDWNAFTLDVLEPIAHLIGERALLLLHQPR